MSALKTITTALAKGGQHIGDLVYWTLADARIARPELVATWTKAGLDPTFLPEPPTAEKAMKNAARLAATGQADRLVRLAWESEQEVIFAVVRETKHSDGSLTYTQEARITLDRNTEKATTDAPGHDIASAILGRYAELRDTHPPDDLRRAMMNVLASCAAVTLRDHGGVYWVPGPHAGTLRKLQAAVEKIGSSRVYLLPVHASADATKTLGEAAKVAIEDELAALKAEVEGFLASPPDRPSTLARRLDAFESLQSRASLYRDVLNVHVADLDATLASLTTAVETLLVQKAAA